MFIGFQKDILEEGVIALVSPNSCTAAVSPFHSKAEACVDLPSTRAYEQGPGDMGTMGHGD